MMYAITRRGIVGKKEFRLTENQREFMLALQRAVIREGGPATVPGIVEELGKSDSRVRSHIKRLTPYGYVCCVGKTRHKRYVPGRPWIKEKGVKEESCPYIGGICQSYGCEELAVIFWRSAYLCRGCMVGAPDKKDPTGRLQYYKTLELKSPAGDMADEGPGSVGSLEQMKKTRRKRKKREAGDVLGGPLVAVYE